MGADALAGHRQGGGLAFLSPWHEFRASIASPPSTQILYATSFQDMLRFRRQVKRFSYFLQTTSLRFVWFSACSDSVIIVPRFH